MAHEIRLRRERLRRGWSLTRVASLTMISPSDLSQLERSLKPAFPSWRKRLSLAFNLPESRLFAPSSSEDVSAE